MTINLETLNLAKGAHNDRDNGLCLLEAVAWLAGEPHSDHPACVSPILGVFGRQFNDALPDDRRQELRRFVPLLPGTAGDGRDQARGLMAADWLIRIYTPAWMELAGLDATALRGLPVMDSWNAVAVAQPVLDDARSRAAAAGAAARAAAWAAAGDAAWAAAWNAARAAAGAAARDAAWAAAGDAARDAAWAAAGDAAGAAAGDAAGDAAWAAAGAAAGNAAGAAAWNAAGAAARAAAGDAARAAAGDAARDVLAPTVAMLQGSAVELFGRMITGE